MNARDDYPISHLGKASDDRTIGELLLIRNQMADEIDRLRTELLVATNRLRNAEGALTDAGTWCDGPADIVPAIARIAANR